MFGSCLFFFKVCSIYVYISLSKIEHILKVFTNMLQNVSSMNQALHYNYLMVLICTYHEVYFTGAAPCFFLKINCQYIFKIIIEFLGKCSHLIILSSW